jgi:hypothetical protein
MTKSLFNKHLSTNLFPFCFRLCPTVSGNRTVGAEATGSNRTQIGHKIRLKLFYSNCLRVCVRDSAGGK